MTGMSRESTPKVTYFMTTPPMATHLVNKFKGSSFTAAALYGTKVIAEQLRELSGD